jgi:hypothetical protein
MQIPRDNPATIAELLGILRDGRIDHRPAGPDLLQGRADLLGAASLVR